MKHAMSFFMLAALSVFALMQCAEPAAPATEEAASPQPTHEDTVKRGEFLVSIMGCHDCHSPKQIGANGEPELIPDRLLSGYPQDRPVVIPSLDALQQGYMLMGSDLTSWIGPWGMSFCANLTGDATGVGNWTFEQFKRAVTEGKYKGLESGRPLLPPMAFFLPAFKSLPEEDLAAMFTYLKSVKPVNNVPPTPIAPDQLKK